LTFFVKKVKSAFFGLFYYVNWSKVKFGDESEK